MPPFCKKGAESERVRKRGERGGGGKEVDLEWEYERRRALRESCIRDRERGSGDGGGGCRSDIRAGRSDGVSPRRIGDEERTRRVKSRTGERDVGIVERSCR